MNRILRAAALLPLLTFAVVSAHAQVTVKDPWVRATVAEQRATGAYMQITSVADARLVAVSSPLAGAAGIHEMALDKGIMKMRPLSNGLRLPAGKTVVLKSGGNHVMLTDLKQAVKEGDVVPLTLVIEGRDQKRATVDVTAQVKPLTHGGHTGGMDHSKH